MVIAQWRRRWSSVLSWSCCAWCPLLWVAVLTLYSPCFWSWRWSLIAWFDDSRPTLRSHSVSCSGAGTVTKTWAYSPESWSSWLCLAGWPVAYSWCSASERISSTRSPCTRCLQAQVRWPAGNCSSTGFTRCHLDLGFYWRDRTFVGRWASVALARKLHRGAGINASLCYPFRWASQILGTWLGCLHRSWSLAGWTVLIYRWLSEVHCPIFDHFSFDSMASLRTPQLELDRVLVHSILLVLPFVWEILNSIWRLDSLFLQLWSFLWFGCPLETMKLLSDFVEPHHLFVGQSSFGALL